MLAVIKRAWQETFTLLGGWGIVFGALAIPCVGFYLHYRTSGIAEMLGEVQVWLIYGAAATVTVFTAVFVFNLLRAPYLIERDEHNRTKSRLTELERDTPFPNAVLRSLSETQEKAESLNQQLFGIAMLVEQYRRLFDATTKLSQTTNQDLKYSEIVEISSFLIQQSKVLLPPLPHSPAEPLIFGIGWNKYRYIFNVPMRVPPRVTFPSLPEDISAEVHNVSRLFVDVQFYNSSHSNDPILPQSFFADAELTE